MAFQNRDGELPVVLQHVITCVIPCFNEQDALPDFMRRMCETADAMRARWPELHFDLIFVDDASVDKTLSLIQGFASEELDGIQVRWVSFSRNFGKESAMLAGFERALGEFVCTLDADLQDPPELLEQMYELVQSGECDVAAARRMNRAGDSGIHALLAHMFYRISARLLSVEIPDGARDYRLMNRAALRAILSLPEADRFSKGLFAWIGFKTRWIDYHDTGRCAGKSGWSYSDLLRYAFSSFFSFSEKPLRFVSAAGAVLTVLALLGSCFIVIRALLLGDPVPGWPSIACLITFLGGLQILCLSVIGGYVARNFVMLKGRPAYIVREESACAVRQLGVVDAGPLCGDKS